MAVKVSKKKAAAKKTSSKTAAKKTTSKKAAAKPVKEKTAKKEKAQKEPRELHFRDRITYAAELVLSQKYTDKALIDEVNKKFTDYPGSPKEFNQKEVGRVRWMLRNDKLVTMQLQEGQEYGKLFEHPETGKLVKREDMPKRKVASKKIKKEDDPLNNIAGVNVHDKEEKQDEKKKTVVKKKTAKKSKVKDLAEKIKKQKA